MTKTLFAELSVTQVLSSTGGALLITSLLLGYEFQRIPTYQVGDIADRMVEAPNDFTVEDKDATFEQREKIKQSLPVVFDLDLRVNYRVESELRSAFGNARHLIAEEKERLGLNTSQPLPKAAHAPLLMKLKKVLPRLSKGKMLEIFFRHSFSPELETQLVRMLQEAMRYPPGVVLTRDSLWSYQQRGILLRNVISGQDQDLKDWAAIHDLEQILGVLRQLGVELTVVSGEEKRQVISSLHSWIRPNILLNEEATRDLEQNASREVGPVLIQVKKGRTIVRSGDEIQARDLMLLRVLKEQKEPRRLVGEFVGIFLIVNFFLMALWKYLLVSHRRRTSIQSQFLLLGLILLLNLIVTKVVIGLADMVSSTLTQQRLQDPIQLYFLAPIAFGAILIVLLVDIHAAIYHSLLLAVLVTLLSGEIPLLIYSLTGSLTAVYLWGQYRERSTFIKAGFIIGSINVLTILSLQLYFIEENFQWVDFAIGGGLGLFSGLLAAVSASLLLPILESLFGITTDIRLLELSNLNNPILRRLALNAPGTYHHSIIVGTIAEAAAGAIGSNGLLVRVGAYYHDIGKLKKPEYYVENQIYEGNKHESLSPSMSSLILSSHVKEGLAMAEKVDLAPEVRELIPQHHGTRLMTYFYHKAKNSSDEKHEVVNEVDYRYPGPKPQSKEAAILMLADQIEAAARSLQEPTPGRIRTLIDRLIQSTIQDGQFGECDITMRDLDQIAHALNRVITGMYHHRIEYPGFELDKQSEEKRPTDQHIQ